MKKQWHLKNRFLLSVILLILGVLTAVALFFNLSVYGYVRARVSAQLASVADSVVEERTPRGQQQGRSFDGKPDKIIGTKGNAVIIGKDGTVISAIHGNPEIAGVLADRLSSGRLKAGAKYALVRTDSSVYAVSMAEDPADEGAYLVSYVDVTSLNALTGRMNFVLIIVIIAASLISILISRRFARRFTEPVRKLSRFAGEIGGGNLEPEKLEFGEIEFEELADSMNLMATELREEKTKQETFFQNVSHELRTPLTSIRGNAEGIVMGVMEPKDAGRVILDESDKLNGLVEEILYLARMGRKAEDKPAKPIDVREVLSLIVSEQRAGEKASGIGFELDFDDEPVMLAMKERDAEMLFGNLVSNAVRYARTSVRITCRNEDGGKLIEVKDDGKGVSEEDLPHIFERFYKGEGGKHGIGLSIAKAAAEAYNGNISAYNDGGAVFRVRFGN